MQQSQVPFNKLRILYQRIHFILLLIIHLFVTSQVKSQSFIKQQVDLTIGTSISQLSIQTFDVKQPVGIGLHAEATVEQERGVVRARAIRGASVGTVFDAVGNVCISVCDGHRAAPVVVMIRRGACACPRFRDFIEQPKAVNIVVRYAGLDAHQDLRKCGVRIDDELRNRPAIRRRNAIARRIIRVAHSAGARQPVARIVGVGEKAIVGARAIGHVPIRVMADVLTVERGYTVIIVVGHRPRRRRVGVRHRRGELPFDARGTVPVQLKHRDGDSCCAFLLG